MTTQDNNQDSSQVGEEIVLVTVKQYLAVADHVLNQIFPVLPESFWANTGHPHCSVYIKRDNWNLGFNRGASFG